MAEFTAPTPPPAPGPSKACDYCRRRKVRCDRGSPCSNCQRATVQCIISQRVSRPRRRRVMLSSVYEGKLDSLDRKLDQVGRIMDTLAAPRHTSDGTELSTHTAPTHGTSTPRSIDRSSTSRLAIHGKDPPDSQIISGRRETSIEPADERVVEGLSSLSANSKFAIDLMHRVAGADLEQGYNFETRDLLDRLQQIVSAVKGNRMTRCQSFTTALLSEPSTDRDHRTMPPIQAAVAVIQKAQEQSNDSFPFVAKLVESLSLSDLCLKVYFSQEYSAAQYIIINVALYFFFNDEDIRLAVPKENGDSYDGYQRLCQENVESALSRVPLVFAATYDMVLALVSGEAIYAVDVSKPALAWTYITAAQEAGYRLGFNTRANGADASGIPNKMGLLFWVVYYLEKTLCLRLGRCSTILDIEITVPLPGGSPVPDNPLMGYLHQQVRFANLAGRTYERLYGAHALSQPDEQRWQRVKELSRELQDIRTKSYDALSVMFRSDGNENRTKYITYALHADDVVFLSLHTLILRAAPAQLDSGTTFTDECIEAARAALGSHQACVPALRLARTTELTSYIHWTILFAPFIPFIALFCHVIETGDLDDLNRMHTFVSSLESAREQSTAIAKHHALFQVFHNVAARYIDLKSASTPTQSEQAEQRVEMGTYLSELGFQPQMMPPSRDGIEGSGRNGSAVEASYVPVVIAGELPGGYNEVDQAAQLANWLTVSQEMMGLMDNNELPF